MIRERVSYFHGPSKVMGTKKGGISHGNTVRTREREREKKDRIEVKRGKENVKKEDKGRAREGDDKERQGRKNKHSDDLHR